MGHVTRFGGYSAGDDLSEFDWIKKWNTAAVADILGIGFERVGSGVSSADGTTYTFSALIPEAGQYIVGVFGNAAATLAGVQGVAIDGQVGNELREDVVTNDMTISWWIMNPTSFANGDINVTFNAAQSRAAVAVWRIYGNISGTYSDNATAAFDVLDTISLGHRTVLLGVAGKSGGADATDIFWSGLKEWIDDFVDGTAYLSAADLLLVSDETTRAITATSNGTPGSSLWSALAFSSPVTYFPSGQGVDFSKQSSNALVFWSWNNGPVAADVEVLALVRPAAQSDTFDCGILVRGNGTVEAAADGYAFLLSQTSAGQRNRARLVRIDTSVITELDTEVFSWSLDTNYWLKLRVRGTTLQAKVWAESSAEPADWNIETTDSEITADGTVGLFHRFTGTSFEVGHFEAKILYAEWPEDTIPNNWTVNIQGGPQSNKVSFKPDVGPSIERKRASSINRMYQVECPGLTQEEYLAFVEFYHVTLKEGTLPFTAMDPFTGVEKTFKFGADDPAYQETVQRSPGPDYTNGIYQLNFSVVRLD